MVSTVILVRALYCGDVTWILNNAYNAFIPCFALAYRAKLIIRKITADFALPYFV